MRLASRNDDEKNTEDVARNPVAQKVLDAKRNGKRCFIVLNTGNDEHLGSVSLDGVASLLYAHSTRSGETHHYRHVPALPGRCKIECMSREEITSYLLEPDCVLTEAGETVIASLDLC